MCRLPGRMSSISRVQGMPIAVEPAAVNDRTEEDGIDVRTSAVGHQALCVATTRGPEGRPPLLLFNGIGANWQLAKPFLHALTNAAAIIFDIPGIGRSPLPSLPYRPATIARPAAGAVPPLG